MEELLGLLPQGTGDLRNFWTGVIWALAGVLAWLVADRILFGTLLRGLRRTRLTSAEDIAHCLRKPLSTALMLLFLRLALESLELPQQVHRLGMQGLTIVFFVSLYLGISRVASILARELQQRAPGSPESDMRAHIAPFLQNIIRVVVLVVLSIMAFQNMGYDISGLLASLGIGGIAVALAAKDSISNVFGSLTIMLDRPFSVGDWVKGEGFEGIVEEVGFRSTRVRTFAKTMITVPNSQIATMTVENFSRMPIRRVSMTLGILYSTPAERVQAIIGDIRLLLAEHPEIDNELVLVNFTDFGSSSLDIFLYYFTRTTNWARYLELREEINLRIMQIVHDQGSDFAFPTRTIHMEPAQTQQVDQHSSGELQTDVQR